MLTRTAGSWVRRIGIAVAVSAAAGMAAGQDQAPVEAAGTLTIASPVTRFEPEGGEPVGFDAAGVVPTERGGFTVAFVYATSQALVLGDTKVAERTYDAAGTEVRTTLSQLQYASIELRHFLVGLLPPVTPGGATRPVRRFSRESGAVALGFTKTDLEIGRRLDIDGSITVGPTFSLPRSVSEDVAAAPDGSAMVVHEGGDQASGRGPLDPAQPDVPDAVYLSRVTPDGTVVGPLAVGGGAGPEVTGATLAVVHDPRATIVNCECAAMVAWSEEGVDGSGAAIRISRSDALSVSPAITVNSGTAGDQLAPSVATLAGGGVATVWTSGAVGATATSVRARVVRPDRTFATAEMPIATGTAISNPEVTALLGGGFLVSWFDGTSLRARTFDASAQPVSQDLLVATRPTAAPTSSALLSDGRVVLAWDDAFTVLDPDVAGTLGTGVTPLSGLPGRTAIVSLASANSAGPGYVQVLPCGTAPGSTSNVNSDAAGQTRAGVAAVTFDAIGRACVYQQGGGSVIADIQGYFTPVAFEDVADSRLLDTRTTTRPTAGSTSVVRARAGSFAVVSLTATGSSAPGYLQVLPCGTTPGSTSNLNLDRAGQTRATLAIVPFAADGTACVYSSAATDIVVDLQGYLAQYIPATDGRILDTRSGPRPTGGSFHPLRGSLGNSAFVSVTVTETGGPGYVQLVPCDTPPGTTSNVNHDAAGMSIANLGVIGLGGDNCAFNSAATHVIVDVQGYMTGIAWADVPDVRVLDTRVTRPQLVAPFA